MDDATNSMANASKGNAASGAMGNAMLAEHLRESAAVMRERMGERTPKIGMILGSGLGPLAERIENAVCIPFGEVGHMRCSTAQNHAGRFVAGSLAGREVLAMQGRLHGYEGYTAQEVAYPVWLMAQLGVDTVIITNAAGGINETYRPGDFCLMADHINFMGRNPLLDPVTEQLGARFFSMTDAYTPELREIAKEVAAGEGICVHEGVYLGLPGPSFETPAEIRAFRAWGADTVAMSAIDEVIAARQQGMRILGVSLVSNMAAGVGSVAGVGGASPTGGEVFDTAQKAERDFVALIEGVVSRL